MVCRSGTFLFPTTIISASSRGIFCGTNRESRMKTRFISIAVLFVVALHALLAAEIGKWIQRLPDGQMQIEVQSRGGVFYDLESSMDLEQWERIGTRRAPTNNLLFIDILARRFPWRFYRIREVTSELI